MYSDSCIKLSVQLLALSHLRHTLIIATIGYMPQLYIIMIH